MPTRAPTHKPPWWKPRSQLERKRKALLDRHRPSAKDRGYDKAWRALRARFLAAYPSCMEPGCRRAATDVDHRITIALRPDLRLEWSNLRSLCHPHHSSHTARTQGFARPRPA